jgi:hypothetical protein
MVDAANARNSFACGITRNIFACGITSASLRNAVPSEPDSDTSYIVCLVSDILNGTRERYCDLFHHRREHSAYLVLRGI